MTRVLLVNPPSPEQLGSPLLGQQYVAAALLARGCEVRVLDADDVLFVHALTSHRVLVNRSAEIRVSVDCRYSRESWAMPESASERVNEY